MLHLFQGNSRAKCKSTQNSVFTNTPTSNNHYSVHGKAISYTNWITTTHTKGWNTLYNLEYSGQVSVKIYYQTLCWNIVDFGRWSRFTKDTQWKKITMEKVWIQLFWGLLSHKSSLLALMVPSSAFRIHKIFTFQGSVQWKKILQIIKMVFTLSNKRLF